MIVIDEQHFGTSKGRNNEPENHNHAASSGYDPSLPIETQSIPTFLSPLAVNPSCWLHLVLSAVSRSENSCAASLAVRVGDATSWCLLAPPIARL